MTITTVTVMMTKVMMTEMMVFYCDAQKTVNWLGGQTTAGYGVPGRRVGYLEISIIDDFLLPRSRECLSIWQKDIEPLLKESAIHSLTPQVGVMVSQPAHEKHEKNEKHFGRDIQTRGSTSQQLDNHLAVFLCRPR